VKRFNVAFLKINLFIYDVSVGMAVDITLRWLSSMMEVPMERRRQPSNCRTSMAKNISYVY